MSEMTERDPEEGTGGRRPMRVAEISSAAIRRNVVRIREIVGPEVAVIAVVKANGYGHGAATAARAALAGGATLIGVTDIAEALELREAGIDEPVLCWLHGADADFESAVAAGVEIGVSRLEQLEAVAVAAERLGLVATVQFKIDTGLSRNGAAPAEWDELFARGDELQRVGLVRVRGIFSHLANTDEEADRAQAERFDSAIEQLRAAGVEPELIHLAASAAVFTSPELHYNAVRVGVSIYGLSPLDDYSSEELGLVPAMTLVSELVMLRTVPEGSGVSYGHTHVVDSESVLGLVPIGYADGLPRTLSGRGQSVLVAGERAPILGRIGMDQCIVDLSDLRAPVSVGDRVVMFGDPASGEPSIDEWAWGAGTINYEIAVGIGNRVIRIESDDDDADDPEGPDDPSIEREISLSDPDAMREFGVTIGVELRAGDLIILTGPLGAGKTTLTRGIGEGLRVRGPITSPTFVLARTHPSLVDGPPLVHVDAYRLSDPSEADDLDLDFENSVVVAEWGAGIVGGSDSWLEIVIERPVGAGAGLAGADVDADEELVEPRTLRLRGHGPRWHGAGLFG